MSVTYNDQSSGRGNWRNPEVLALIENWDGVQMKRFRVTALASFAGSYSVGFYNRLFISRGSAYQYLRSNGFPRSQQG